MSMIGGDAFAIRDFARKLAARKAQIEETQARMSALVESVPWVGADRERFMNEWNTIHRPNLARMILDLGTVVGDAHTAADAQARASQAQ